MSQMPEAGLAPNKEGRGSAESTEACMTNVTWTLRAYTSHDRTIEHRCFLGHMAAVFVWKQKKLVVVFL